MQLDTSYTEYTLLKSLYPFILNALDTDTKIMHLISNQPYQEVV